MSMAPAFQVESFHHPATGTYSHVLWDPASRQCAVVDSVLDYDPHAGRTATHSADRLIASLQARGLQLVWLLETHVHADHLSAAAYLKSRLGGQVAVGAGITRVQRVFGELFDAGPEFSCDGRPFDRLLSDGDTLPLGALRIQALSTPGHTPACTTFVVSGDDGETAAFVGDTLFMPDVGTARCDFPGGDAHTLYRSIQRVLGLPGSTRLYLCHDYPPEGRAPQCLSTVAEQRRANVHLSADPAGAALTSEADFVRLRQTRDAGLDLPALILPAVQVNMRAGQLPPPDRDGRSYLKIPLNALLPA